MVDSVSGKQGLVQRSGVTVLSINNWSIDIDSNMLDHTSFSSSAAQWRDWAVGLSGWSGSFEGFFNQASTAQNDEIAAALTPSTATIILELDQAGGGSFTGATFISSLGAGSAIDGDSTIAFGFQGTGAPTFSTST